MNMTLMVFPFLLALLPAAANAEERHLGPHVHGQASVGVSVEADALDVQLSLPGHDAVGFEHPPGSVQERAALDKALATLKAATWLVPAADAGCTLVSATVSPHGFGGATEPGGHADIDAVYHYTCHDAARLDHVDVRLAAAFPGLQKIVVDTIGGSGSNQQTLQGTASHVDLQP
ncbi:DUF2796 domain-containing protein [Xanthomonas sp. NCPPB 2632]|jgi:hypothetical protein|uniref:ZrgA family zinc uptake protein n=1 Tax=Xanthomonas sp. NCPPB 2632 TaxID=3240912 RepID=UPI003514E3FA